MNFSCDASSLQQFCMGAEDHLQRGRRGIGSEVVRCQRRQQLGVQYTSQLGFGMVGVVPPPLHAALWVVVHVACKWVFTTLEPSWFVLFKPISVRLATHPSSAILPLFWSNLSAVTFQATPI